MTKNTWIQKALKKSKKGSLKLWAKSKKLINKQGNISLNKALKYAKKKGLTKRTKQINLAKTLKKLRGKK